MIEPGPVHTEFETKMMENVAKMEYPGVDPDTVRYFKDVYLPSSIDIFEAMGQMPDDIAKVRRGFISKAVSSFESQRCIANIQPDSRAMNSPQTFLFAPFLSSVLKRLLSRAALASGI